MVRFILRSLLLFVFLLMGGFCYAIWPRQADLRGFDPETVAKLETHMWRDYYTHDYTSLAKRLYRLYRNEYHYSPADSAQLAYTAAKAAQIFQPSHNRAEAEEALPLLEHYFMVLKQSSGEKFDSDELARLELNWWQMRRENTTAQEYGAVIAESAGKLFGVQNEEVTRSSLGRAEMMHYRDERRDGRMTSADWTHIEEKLTESYRLLKAGVAKSPLVLAHDTSDARPTNDHEPIQR